MSGEAITAGITMVTQDLICSSFKGLSHHVPTLFKSIWHITKFFYFPEAIQNFSVFLLNIVFKFKIVILHLT